MLNFSKQDSPCSTFLVLSWFNCLTSPGKYARISLSLGALLASCSMLPAPNSSFPTQSSHPGPAFLLVLPPLARS